MAARTLVHALRERASQHPTAPALWRRLAEAPHRASNWRDLAAEASRLGRGLLALGLGPERPVAYLGAHRPEWLALELGAMGAGLALAPLFPSWPDATLADGLRRLRARAVIVDGPRALARVSALRGDLPDLELAIDLEPVGAPQPWVRAHADVLAAGAREPEALWDARTDALAPDAVASVTLTPGTLGAPRVVRHTHAAVLAHARRLGAALGARPGDALLARLAPAVALERAMLRLAPVAGAQVWVAPPAGGFLDHLREARPTIVHAPAADWEALRRLVEERLAAESPNRSRVTSWARAVALGARRRLDASLSVPGPRRAQLALARGLVLDPLKVALGLQAARVLVGGLSRMRLGTLELFASLDLPLDEAWGQAELCGPATLNRPHGRRPGTAGRPLPGLAVRVEAGEVLVRGDTACLEGAAEGGAVLEAGGWLRTGDLGALDGEGFLSVLGRADEVLSVRGRRRVPAEAVEARLRAVPLVAQAIAAADGGRPVALLALDRDGAARLARERGLPDDPAQLAAHPTLLALLERELARVQADAPEPEVVRRFAVLPGGLSADAGELTPAGTVRRQVVLRRRAELVARLLEREPRRNRAARG